MFEKNCCKIENIKTKRLSLRTYKSTDFDIIYSLLINEKVTRYLLKEVLFSKSDTNIFIQNSFCGFKIYGNMIVLDKKSNILGFAGIQKCESFMENDYEFGFAFLPRFWGNGFATEIANGLIHYARNYMKIPRIVATVSPKNIASIKVMKKIHMNYLHERLIANRGERFIYVKMFYEEI